MANLPNNSSVVPCAVLSSCDPSCYGMQLDIQVQLRSISDPSLRYPLLIGSSSIPAVLPRSSIHAGSQIRAACECQHVTKDLGKDINSFQHRRPNLRHPPFGLPSPVAPRILLESSQPLSSIISVRWQVPSNARYLIPLRRIVFVFGKRLICLE